MTDKPCEHLNFTGDIRINRLSHEEGGPIDGYSADVAVRCADCGLPFRFIGIPAGNHFAEPRVSVDGLELRAPIEPATHDKFSPSATYVAPPNPKKGRMQ